MKHAATVLCMLLFAMVAGGATVEVTTSGWTGSRTTNGWSFANLGGPFPDGAVQFGDGAAITSPLLRRQIIIEVTVTLECSSVTPTGNITYVLLRNGQVVSPQRTLWPVAFANRRESQSQAVNPELRANAVRFLGTDGWSVYSVKLLTRPSPSPGFAILIS